MRSERPSTIPFVDFGGAGPHLHFAHANGFPPDTYRGLIGHLTDPYHVFAMRFRPLWPGADPQHFHNWEQAADDLIAFLDAQGCSGIVGVGHSFGAICSLIAATKRPDLFSSLVLIEPVVLPSWVYVISSLLPKAVIKHLNPVVKRTLARKERWSSREQAFRQFRKKKVFRGIADDQLWDYVNAVTTPQPDGTVQLNYSKEWEARIYLTVSDPWKYIRALNVPCLVIKGEHSDTMTAKVWASWQARKRNETLMEVPGTGHLIPLEAPEQTASIIKRFLNHRNHQG